MKTIKEWLSELPEPYRSEALDNMEAKNVKVFSMKEALLSAFAWCDSLEGFEYWDKLRDSL